MTISKFTKQDRQLVITKLEEIQRTRLQPVPGTQKLFTDKHGRFYGIFGATGDWHGAPEALMKQIEANASKTLLVVAKKYATRIDLCVATADGFVSHKDDLPRTRVSEEYIFKTYRELEEFFESVKQFTVLREAFLVEQRSAKHEESK